MSRSNTRSRREGTPVAPLFRVWLWIEVLFGLAAISVLGLRPDETATRFAWHIEPEVMASALGGFYIATAPTLLLQAVARRWEMIRVFVLPAIAFTTAELIATLLHLDRFSVGTLPFNVWLASYVLPPGIFLLAYGYHQRRASPRSATHALPQGLRRALLLIGGLWTISAVIGFVFPLYLTGSWPWELTPLTARVLAGWEIALATLLLSIAWENDRDRVRLAAPMLILVLPCVALQVGRFADQVDFAHQRLWIGAALLSFTAAVGVYLARGSWLTSLR
jgi:hypothetical protein